MEIKDILIKNFRSYDSEGIALNDLGKINIFIGKNNSGKSNLLRFLKLISIHHNNLKNFPISNLEDQHRRNGEGPELTIRFEAGKMFDIYEKLRSKYNENDIFEITINFKALAQNADERIGTKTSIDSITVNTDLLALQSSFSGADNDTLINAIYTNFLPCIKQFISRNFEKLIYIPHFRQIKNNDNTELDSKNINGDNIIYKMFQMQNPKLGEESHREKFLEIQNFVRQLIGVNDLTIEIPHDRETIIIEMHGNRLPLESFGTGIHELVLLCSALSIYDNHLVCIEEPEIHLHPELQRKFMDFINGTNNVYFITSHSNIFLDYSNKVNIYHVSNNSIATKISKCISSRTTYDLLDDLHYKASSLLQSNSIIWVEGPSDRIYINKWISLLEPDLQEGLHYSVMFYGGRLLSHLSMDEENTELIALLRINKNSIIVIDRDGNTDTAKINNTKARIESETNRGLCWITHGREIENYISLNTLQRYLGTRNYTETLNFRKSTKIETVLSATNLNIKYETNKVKYAKEFVNFIVVEDLDVFDLNEKINAIITKITQWNNLQ